MFVQLIHEQIYKYIYCTTRNALSASPLSPAVFQRVSLLQKYAYMIVHGERHERRDFYTHRHTSLSFVCSLGIYV